MIEDVEASHELGTWVAPPRAWYASSIENFITTDSDSIVGQMVRTGGSTLLQTQAEAWRTEIDFLRDCLHGSQGWILFEFSIPRMGRRIDVVLLVGSVVFVVEFKVGSATFDRAAVEQVWDYALDLKNFHEASHELPIVPILVATASEESPRIDLHADADGVYRPVRSTGRTFRGLVETVLSSVRGDVIDPQRWMVAPYKPTPTIIEAARALYAQHSVDEIARHDAGAENLRTTSAHIEAIVAEAKRSRHKVICFVTGVPGAGKTLVGLNVATRQRDLDTTTPAVYLSGNGPLVAVLREALTRDEVARQRKQGTPKRKGQVAESVKAFVQNVHHFRDEALRDPNAPADHVAVFDEAQRAWTQHETANFMRRRKNRADFPHSEPEFLISYMDRHRDDWAVIVCLVGGGQEINRGEAGIDAWLDAINSSFPDWRMYISSRLTDSEYAAGRALDVVRNRPRTYFDDSLHLSVSMRSFRAENVSAFVKAVLDRDRQGARATLKQLGRYPIVMTRDLNVAKNWLRAYARGSERFGLLASSKAYRLKPHAIDVRIDVNPVSWFLNDRDDTRSSYYLEDAATEFQVQGLELDWTCVTWDADLRSTSNGWSYHDFRGKRWLTIKNEDNRRYLLNAYRVLLTRARQGMVIFVPPGDRNDPTRSPEYYDHTFESLTDLGIEILT